jgi:hypothetical protein
MQLPIIRPRSVSSYMIMSKMDHHMSIAMIASPWSWSERSTHHYDYPPQSRHLLQQRPGLPITLSRSALFTVNDVQDASSIITTTADTPQRRSIQDNNQETHSLLTTKTPSPHCHHIYYLHMLILYTLVDKHKLYYPTYRHMFHYSDRGLSHMDQE